MATPAHSRIVLAVSAPLLIVNWIICVPPAVFRNGENSLVPSAYQKAHIMINAILWPLESLLSGAILHIPECIPKPLTKSVYMAIRCDLLSSCFGEPPPQRVIV